MLLATFLFTLANTLVKVIDHIPAVQIVLFRAFISLGICWVLLKRAGVYPWGKYHKWLISRGVFGSIALILFFMSIQRLPLANALVIFYITPIITSIVGAVWLKERLYPIQALFFIVSLAGIAIIKGFDPRVDTIGLAMGLGAALFSAGAYTSIRRMKDLEHPLVIVMFFPLVTIPIVTPLVAYDWVMPIDWDWLVLIAIGLLTQFAQVSMTKGYQMEEVARASSVTYSGVIYGLVFGFFLFDETFNWLVIGGMLLVIIGILLNVNVKRILGKG